jgi:hypothetical protein
VIIGVIGAAAKSGRLFRTKIVCEINGLPDSA